MKTHFEFVYFVKINDGKRNTSWDCFSQKDNSFVGRVKFDFRTKQHVYLPNSDTAYPSLSLNDISNFITILDNS